MDRTERLQRINRRLRASRVLSCSALSHALEVSGPTVERDARPDLWFSAAELQAVVGLDPLPRALHSAPLDVALASFPGVVGAYAAGSHLRVRHFLNRPRSSPQP